MCKKQTSVSHSSTESEIISLDAGLRLDGITALDLSDLIVAVSSLRMTVTWDVTSVTNLIIYAVILEGANIEVRPDKSERNAVCQVRRLNTVAPTTGFDRELYKRVFLTRR